jgi:hypothetical protein
MSQPDPVLAAIARLRRGDRPIDERPRSTYELLTRQKLDELRDRVNSLDTKVNGLLFGMLTLVVAEVYKAVTK